MLSEKVRQSPDITGINIDTTNFQISQLADDTTLFLKDKHSVQTVLDLLKHFELCAGLKLNKSKSEAIMLGNSNHLTSVCGIKIIDKPVKLLGIWICKETNNIPELNFTEKLSKFKHLLNMWKQRKLSLKGKVTIVNSLALPQMIYAASVLYVPPDIIHEVNSLIFSFLWPKKAHVKKNTIIASLEEGGLKMPDFEQKHKACKAMWVKRLLSYNNKCSVFVKSFGLPLPLKEMCTCRFDMSYLINYKSDFYKQVLNAWYQLKDFKCVNASDVRREFIWLNKNIIVENKPLFIKRMYQNCICTINDILDNEGNFLPLEYLTLKFNVNISVMDYNSIKASIPLVWRKLVRSSSVIYVPEDLEVKIGNSWKPIEKLYCKELYWEYVNRIVEKPTAIHKWEESFYYINFDWKYTFTMPYVTCKETSLQSLQYKILHRFFPCNYIVHKWYPHHSALCSDCNLEDTIEHYFYECSIALKFWIQFYKWWKNVTLCNINLCLHDIIFGVFNPTNCLLIKSLNFCILLGKSFIYKKKKKSQEVTMYIYLIELKNRLQVENVIACQNGQEEHFNNQWLSILDCL